MRYCDEHNAIDLASKPGPDDKHVDVKIFSSVLNVVRWFIIHLTSIIAFNMFYLKLILVGFDFTILKLHHFA